MIQDGLFDVDRVAGQNVFSQKCAKVVNSWEPATQLYFCDMYLAMSSKSQGIKGGRFIVAFR
jgi:hypothetical protein